MALSFPFREKPSTKLARACFRTSDAVSMLEPIWDATYTMYLNATVGMPPNPLIRKIVVALGVPQQYLCWAEGEGQRFVPGDGKSCFTAACVV